MRRPRFGSVLAAVAIATAGLIPIFVSPAGATNNCGPGGGSTGAVNASAGSEFPVGPGALAQLKIDCHSDAGVSADNIILHDAADGNWHHGAARSVTITPTSSSTAISYASGAIGSADIGRSISFTCQTGGSYILTAGLTSGTVSKANKTGCVANETALIEYSTNRLLQDVSCTSGSTTLTGTANDLFSAADIGRSVSGGPYGGAGGPWRITAVNSPVNTATISAPAPEACPTPAAITIGAQSYATTTPFGAVWPSSAMTVQLSNSAAGTTGAGGQGFTCSGSNLALAGSATTAIPSFSAGWVGLKVVVIGTTTVTTTVASFSSPNLVLAAPCPAGISSVAGSATIGVPDANAPVNGAAMMELNAELNLNPSLVKTQDNCDRNSIEGFEVVGMWRNPGSYTAGTVAVPVSTGQIAFPTAVVTFAGNIVPKKGGDTQEVGVSHWDFVFPSLPTSSAVCLTPPITGTPSNPTQLAFAFASTTLSGGLSGAGPFLQTGAGNPQDPGVRSLDLRTGAFAGKYELRAGTTQVLGSPGSTFSCTVPASTAVPALTCGDG